MAVLSGRVSGAGEAYFGYLLRQAREHNWRRKRKLRSFSSTEDWQAHTQAVREHFRLSLGAFPEKTPLNPQLVDTLERDGYVVEKLLIESQPGFPVTVNLYRPPEITEPLPAVLNPLGHWADGKAQDVVQARGHRPGAARLCCARLRSHWAGRAQPALGYRHAYKSGREQHRAARRSLSAVLADGPDRDQPHGVGRRADARLPGNARPT